MLCEEQALAEEPTQSATEQAGDPTAPMDQYQVLWTLVPKTHGGDGWAQSMEFQAVEFFPRFGALPVQLARITAPLLTTPGPDRQTGLGDIAVFDQLVLKRSRKVSIGVGPALVLPTATHSSLGQGKWQLGVSVGVVNSQVQNLQLGFIAENYWSIAGDVSRPDVRALTLQPILNYVRGKWYFGAGDFVTSIDWTSGNVTLPLAFQVGYVAEIGGHYYNFSVEPAYWAAYTTPAPQWGVRLGAVLMFPITGRSQP
jgi:hypothetical protein